MNIFEVFLPQLLLYPNASDPLNGEAAALLMREPEQYAIRVKESVQKYGRAASLGTSDGGSDESDGDSDSEAGGSASTSASSSYSSSVA